MTTVGKHHHNPTLFADVVCGQKPFEVWVEGVLDELRALWRRLAGPESESAFFAQRRRSTARMRVQSTNGSPVVEFEVRRADKPCIYRRTLDGDSKELEGDLSRWILMTADEIHFHKTISTPIGVFIDACGLSTPWADSDVESSIRTPASSA